MKRMERKGVEIAVKAVRADARAYLRRSTTGGGRARRKDRSGASVCTFRLNFSDGRNYRCRAIVEYNSYVRTRWFMRVALCAAEGTPILRERIYNDDRVCNNGHSW